MPIKHSALRQIRKDRGRRQRNQAVRAELKTLTRRFLGLLRNRQLDEAKATIRLINKRFDRAAAKGVIHRNTAARYKSRLAQRVSQRASA